MKSSASRADQSHGRHVKRDSDNESKQSTPDPVEPEGLTEKDDMARLMKKLLRPK